MPFTLAHPAAIIPVRKLAGRWGVLSALVIGSMAPDFVYFLPIGVTGGFSHSLRGTVAFCLPAGLVVYAVFHALLREPLTALLPEAISNRIDAAPDWIPRTLAACVALALSLIAGALTHIGWDAFTHGNTVVVRNLDVLRYPLELTRGVRIPVYKLLQHLSTIGGLAVLALCVRRWIFETPENLSRSHQLRGRYRNAVLCSFATAAMGGIYAGVLHGNGVSLERIAFEGVVSGMASAELAVLLFCSGWQIVVRRQKAKRNASNASPRES